jgi:hypothetical protein
MIKTTVSQYRQRRVTFCRATKFRHFIRHLLNLQTLFPRYFHLIRQKLILSRPSVKDDASLSALFSPLSLIPSDTFGSFLTFFDKFSVNAFEFVDDLHP